MPELHALTFDLLTGSLAGSSLELSLTTDIEAPSERGFGEYIARCRRYRLYWAHYEGTVYRKVHADAERLKDVYGLYPFTRTIFSPANRIGEFWPGHIMGGPLPAALPLVPAEGAKPELVQAIEQVWRDSNWQVTKETWTRFGSVLGDVGLMVVDDVERSKVYLRVIPPWQISHVNKDPFGNVKEYTFQERRLDPREDDQGNPFSWTGEVIYREEAIKEGESVVFRTYLNDAAYDWTNNLDGDVSGAVAEWTQPYGFVPLVMVQHRDMGLGWGWSELHPDQSKLMEIDDLASKVNDQVRKLVDAPWLFSAVAQSEVTVKPDRKSFPAIFAQDAAAKGQPLVAPMDIGAISAHIEKLLHEIERDHIELQADMATASGDASGRALRVARERTEAMVISRRAGYDDALVRAHMMAISIGAQKGYPGFESFDEGSFVRGELEHIIDDRPVFAVDEMDRLEEEQARAGVIKTNVDAGVPMTIAMRKAGYTEEEIREAMAAKKAEDTAKLGAAQAQQAAALARMGRLPVTGGNPINGRPAVPAPVAG